MGAMGRMRAAAVAASGCVLNALCDGLERKVTALNGGQFDIPLKDFLAQLPRHTKLLDDPSIAGLGAAGFSQSCQAR
jgi:hypothetical protein